jgi:ligand-binding sensor domain-containing protein
MDAALGSSRQQIAQKHIIRLKSRVIIPQTKLGFSLLPAKVEAREGIFFRDRFFIISNQGLVELDSEQQEVRRYSCLDGLPSNRLRALAKTPEALWIGIAPQGILRFDGSRFEYFFAEHASDFEVTALLALPSGELLVGTQQRGLLKFQGDRAVEFTPEIPARFITCLQGDDRRLVVGTIADGLYVFRAGILSHFQRNEGELGFLLDNQITALATGPTAVYVGTPLGITEISDGKVARHLGQGYAIQALALGPRLLAGTNQGLLSISLGGRSMPSQWRPTSGTNNGDESPTRSQRMPPAYLDNVHQIITIEGGWRMLTADGMYEARSAHGDRWRKVGSFAPQLLSLSGQGDREDRWLSDNNISALALDQQGSLWVGYFDRGLDVFSGQGERLLHQEDDRIFCINHIQPLPGGQMAVSTANGLGFYDGETLRSIVTEKEGLIHKSVAMVHAIDASRMVAATAEGVTIFENTRPSQNLFVLHGLANNHVYCAASLGSKTYLGTLGGISVLENLQFVYSWNTANSALAANWINAMAGFEGQLFVGTYGGGVQAMDSHGQWTDYTTTIGKFEVNPNAMAVDGRRLYVGTLDRGFFTYDASQDRWSQVQEGLPSQNVTAFAFDGASLLVGTDQGVVKIDKSAMN